MSTMQSSRHDPPPLAIVPTSAPSVRRSTVAASSTGLGAGPVVNKRRTSGSVGMGPHIKSPQASGLTKAPTGAFNTLPPTASPRMQWLRIKSRQLSDSWRFNVLTTALTVYALFGDDFRMAMTHLKMDIYFNVATLVCIVIFAFEIMAACLGQDEYFLGFFFFLDVGSTATLIFDVTYIGDSIFCSHDDGGALKTSRAGRAGARASRTVRIIRLMRLVKLYKAYKTQLEKKKEEKNRRSEMASDRSSTASMLGPGQEGDDPLLDPVIEDYQEDGKDSTRMSVYGDLEKEEKPAAAESGTRVGKKLSDMTTRRVIILVLVMLFIMPQFTPSSNGIDDFVLSANIGSEMVYDRFRLYCGTLSPDSGLQLNEPWCLMSPDPSANQNLSTTTFLRQQNRAWFERELLKFLYQHHIGDYSYRLYWIGVSSQTKTNDLGSEGKGQNYLGGLMKLNNASYLGSFWSPSSTWDDAFGEKPDWAININNLPKEVQARLQLPWQERCQSYAGVPVQKSFPGSAGGCSPDLELRCSEREYIAPLSMTDDEGRDFSFLFTFDIRAMSTLEAGLSMLQTVFICFAVGLGAMSFSNDANQLLLNPIERMIAKMETIKDNPLEAMRLGDLEYRREEVEQARRKEQLAKMGRCWQLLYGYMYRQRVKEPMETVMLEKTIIKLGGLLALGFGEAGAEVIGQNMQGGHTAGVNAMIPGEKVETIIGYCCVRHFTEATEVLKEKVMLFVNQVAEIVHGCVDDYHGAPNKNTGEAFLVVWRLTGLPPERQTKLADMSVMGFVKMIAEVNKSRVLATYRTHPGLLQRMPNFRVLLGMGLHYGWAIEGAIGSEFKIDATYLSPNVHIAARLQSATVHYGVCMLASSSMVARCSKEVAAACRLIDHVTVRGARRPIRLYTLDLDYAVLPVLLKPPDPGTRNRFKIRQLREVRKNEKWSEDYGVHDAFTQDDDLINMRKKFSSEFFHRFSMAYRNYEAGEWMAARDMLFTCHYAPKNDSGRVRVASQAQWPEDGPTVMLLLFMREYGYQPPHSWPGHRPIPRESRPR